MDVDFESAILNSQFFFLSSFMFYVLDAFCGRV